MKRIVTRHFSKAVKILLISAALVMGGLAHSELHALTLNVVDENGAHISGFRWLLEEDTTHPVTPGVKVTNSAEAAEMLSLSIHKSYAPVAAKGQSIFQSPISITIPDPAKRYYISVLPGSNHTIGGTAIAAGATSATVIVNSLPLPTAQISIFVFEDISPLNNAPDFPQELGLAGFHILIEDPAGLYGIGGGQVTQDAFGNPLGTTYNFDGSVNVMGTGILRTDANGHVLVQNLVPGKYGISVVPPAGQGWQQTSTIEGTKVVDAWVKAGEPSFFQEFGPPGYHVFFGFVKPMNDTAVLNGSNSISGRIVNLHNSRPPDLTFYPGAPINECWVGLNTDIAGTGNAVYSQPCDADSRFSIANVPPGTYQLVVWDSNLLNIFAFQGVTIAPDGSCLLPGGPSNPCDLGDVMVNKWFGTLENFVFFDDDQDGFRDPAEVGMLEQAVNLRFRNGTLYQSVPTDLDGTAPFEEVFPFFHYLVAEVDFARFKATGVTITVDAGGPTGGGDLNPQEQPTENPSNPGDFFTRTETGPVLTQAFQLFAGQTSILEWGKANYGPGENGGISGIVYYATTRAEDDPQFAAAEVWEPGIPRVQVNLYQDADSDGIIDDLNGDGCPTPADVDNYPFGNFPSSEDIKYSAANPPACSFAQVPPSGAFSPGDAVQITTTDSWDDNLPTGCPGLPGTQNPFYVYGNPSIHAQDCFEGMRTFNQIRDGVFDGGYAFTSYHPGGIFTGSTETDTLPDGDYIVEVTRPTGYEHLKSEDRNVDFGDEYTPGGMAPIVAVPPCVGELYTVPPELTLFPGVEAPLAGQQLPLCNRKQVTVRSGVTGGGFNSVSDFFLFTEVPKAGRGVGLILNDLANQFDPNNPAFGEKFAPPWIPVSVRDYRGNEISRTYSDELGSYNILVPSTYTMNVPMPSGASPNMLTVCLNHPGPIEDPAHPGTYITDPYFQREYSQFCYTLQYMPGTTTYLDTPVVPVAAFAGAEQAPLDCELPDGTPVIYSVSGPVGGPYVAATGDTLTIASAGTVNVPNPAYDGANSKTVQRDYGFGGFSPTASKVTLGGVDLANVIWTAGSISGNVPSTLSPGAHQLMVTRANGQTTATGITVTIGGTPPIHVAPGGSIQTAIDMAAEGDLILVAPGTYEELVIMWKDVRLQGWGAFSTAINAVRSPANKTQDWLDKMASIIGNVALSPYLLPGQTGDFNLLSPEPLVFGTEEGPGVFVLGKNDNSSSGRIDGFRIEGGATGGGIFLNGYTDNFTISNNRLVANQGVYGGGLRAGHPSIGADPVDSQNDNLNIHHNQIDQNGSAFSGGGVALYTGTDSYEVTDNFICGNFAMSDGGGILHLGLSNNGMIADNTVIFNQSFSQGQSVSGGGMFIGGIAPVGGEPAKPGSGNVTILSNLIQGNHAGAGDGGGIAAQYVNGADVEASPTDPAVWYQIDIINNIIVNNVAGLAGGAISLQDTANVQIIHNTIANNDSTATASAAFTGGPAQSLPQPAGIISRAHSDSLTGVIGTGTGRFFETFSSPRLFNNIIWHNRSFYWDINENGGTGGLLPLPASPVYNDLGVIGTPAAEQMDPRYCILTNTATYDLSNLSSAPGFVQGYVNGGRGYLLIPTAVDFLETIPAPDEGGNQIDVRYGPLSLMGDYHIQASSNAKDAGSSTPPDYELPTRARVDYDKEARPDHLTSLVDIGADEYYDAVNPSLDVVGPVTSGVIAAPNPTNEAATVTLTATASDAATGNANILSVEWYWDGSDPGPGSANAMTAFAAPFDNPVEIVIDTIDVSTLADGNYTIHVRSQDVNANWGAASSTVLTVNQLPVPDTIGPSTFAVAADPNPTAGAASVTLTAAASDTASGNSNIMAAEWYWDVNNPAPGDGNPMFALDGSFDTPSEIVAAMVPIPPGTIPGNYIIHVRSQDALGLWGPAGSTTINVTEGGGASGTSVIYQCPTDTDGDGVSNDPEVVCIHLTAGDGFVTMADGYPQYIFGFNNVTNKVSDPYNALQVLGAGMLAANLTAPTITVREGQSLYLTVTNVGMNIRPDLFDPHTVHWHGFPNAASIFDGVPDVSISMNQLSSLTYYFKAVTPGTFFYHCHVEATEHMQMGMYGNLWVSPAQDDNPLMWGDQVLGTEYPAGSGKYYKKFAYNDGDGSTGYDVAYPFMISSLDHKFHDASMTVQPLKFADMKDTYPVINGRGYPDTKIAGPLPTPAENLNGGKISQPVDTHIEVTQGQTILLHVSNLSVTRYFTLMSFGIPMKMIAEDTGELVSTTGEKLHYYTNSIDTGPGNSYDVLLYTANVPPGTYFLYTSNLNYLSNNIEDHGGIMTEVKINPIIP